VGDADWLGQIRRVGLLRAPRDVDPFCSASGKTVKPTVTGTGYRDGTHRAIQCLSSRGLSQLALC
jgi:hypothetical protein